MMRWIVGSSLRFRYIVIALSLGMMYFGYQRVPDLPLDVFPEFAPTRVEIQTICLGLSPAEVESMVTVPLENVINGVPGIADLRSKSVPQLSSITVLFKAGVNEMVARQLVAERVGIVTPNLPTWAAPPYMMPPLSSTSRVMKIGISSKTHSVMDLSMLTYWTIRARLLRVPGVANVAIWGEQLKMLQVQVDPDKLVQYKLTRDQVQEATAESIDVNLLRYTEGSHIGTGGFIDTPTQRFELKHTLATTTPETLAQVPIAKRDGKQLLLGDVAKLEWTPPGMVGDAVINDGPGLMLIVEKFPWGNTLEVTRGVESALELMKPGLEGVEVDTKIFRPASFIEVSVDNLSHALMLGSLLVILVIWAFLFEWRSALICVIALPLSLLAAGLMLWFKGGTINVMVLAGLVIALGVVVDDAILDVENIMRRVRQYRSQGVDRSTASIILEASLEVRSPILYATLIVLVTVIPVLFLQGLSGTFFKPLIGAYVLSIAASLLVAITVTPALCLLLLDKLPARGRHGSPFANWLGDHYTRLLASITRAPRVAYVMVFLVTAAGVGAWPFLGHSLLPDFKERDFLMHWVTDPSTSHPEMLRITTRASKELRSIPGVRNFGAHIGQAFLADEVVGVNFAENWISVHPSADYDKTIAAIDELVEGYPGLYRDLQTYLKERVREVLTGSGEAIIVRVFGSDLDTLRGKAEDVRKAMEGIPGITDLKKEIMVDVPHIQVTVDLEKSAKYGLKPGDVRRASGVYMSGEEVADIFAGGRTYDVQLWTTPEKRHSLDSIQNMLLDTPRGQYVALKDVADVRIAPSPNIIKHNNGSRSLDVQANVARGVDLASVAQEVERRLQKVEFPLGYTAVLQGEYIELRAAHRNLALYSVLAAVAVLLLLQLCFNSWRLAFLSFLTLPFALVGGILLSIPAGGIISLGSLVGFLSVLGIAARNGIMMINHFQHLEREEGETFGLNLVLRGARERLTPILMTTGATALAILPLVIYGNLPGHEIEYPMAIVILGGLVTSTLLNLFVLPALFLRVGRNSNRGLSPAV